MTVQAWLDASTKRLAAAGIPTARLDCLVLIEDILQTNRAQLLAHPEQVISSGQIAQLDQAIERRSTHEPLAYIRGKSEFYGREFYVDHRVLEPRPESETMIDLLKALPLPDAPTIMDVGTGSGALAITANLELPRATVCAIDIDPGCLAVATRNAETFGAQVQFSQGNLLESVSPETLNRATLLCNLPYVPDTFQINPAAMREPRLAIFGGPDGLDLYRTLFDHLSKATPAPLFVLTEALPPQHAELTNIARAHHFVLERSDDFIQVFKTAVGSSAS